MKRGEPEAARLWLQIDLAPAGMELRATARGCHGEEPAAHLLGPQSSLEVLLEFAQRVETAAERRVPLKPLTQAQQLYQSLFREGLQEVLLQLRGAAQGEPLLLRLNPGDPPLHRVPWEALCRPGTTVDFLGTSQELCLARGASSTKSFAPYRVEGAVKLLVISPSDAAAPERLRAALHPSIEAGELEWLTPLTGAHASMAYVLQRLRHEPVPHIVHFIGHGGLDESGNPTLRLADREGRESWLKVELWAHELQALFRQELRLVVLEACEGARPGTLPSAAALLAQAGAGAVVAHLWPVRADVARRCSMSFYRSLSGTASHRGDVGRSLHDARRTLLAEFEESAEAFSPVLYLRGYDTTLFDFQGRKLPTASPVATATPNSAVQSVARAPEKPLQPPRPIQQEAPLVLSDPALMELRELYDSGDLVLFSGAGTSSAAGLPGWKRLTELAIEHARRRNDSASRIAEMEELLGRNELVDALSVAHQLFGGAEFGNFVERHLNDQGRALPPALEAIAKLAPKLRAALTTNLDHFLERALQWPPVWSPLADLPRRRRFIYKLHGTLLDRSSWVFTRAQYDHVTWASPLFRSTFSAFFQAWPILFVGFSLVDDNFESLFAQIRALAGDQPPRHFALVPQGALQGVRRGRVEQAGVRLIEYPNLDQRHTEVVRILEWLASKP